MLASVEAIRSARGILSAMGGKLNQQIDNNLAYVHDLVGGHGHWLSRPAWVEFSTNNACNLRCVMCGQSDGEPPQSMKREEASDVLDQLFATATLITPHANSEPLLADLDLVVNKCREHDVYLNLITNATYLDRDRFDAIADRIWSLTFSLDSHLKDVLETVRARIDYDLTMRHIAEVLPRAAELGIKTAFNYVYMSSNASHLAGFVDWMADIGGSEARSVVHVQPMLYNAKGCEAQRVESAYSEDQLQAFLDEACERANERSIILDVVLPGNLARNVTPHEPIMRGMLPDLLNRTIETLRKRYPSYCAMAAYYLKVSPDGRVYPCCVAPDELVMGSVLDSTIEEIWNGDKYRAFRERMHAQDYPESCRNCSQLVDNPDFQAMPDSRRA